MTTKTKPRSPFSVESRKTEIRFVTSDPKKMLGKWVARRALKTWTEDMVDSDTGENVSIERTSVLLERGTYIDHKELESITFMMLIEKYLRDKQEENYLESLNHPERTFVKYDIHSFIETSKIIPIGCFIPVSFSEVYNEADS